MFKVLEILKRGEVFFHILKIIKPLFIFFRKLILIVSVESAWRKKWDGEIFYSRSSWHSRGVCILTDPGVKVNKIECHFNDASGRIVLITLTLNDLLKLSLCRIYAQNNHAKQKTKVYPTTQQLLFNS